MTTFEPASVAVARPGADALAFDQALQPIGYALAAEMLLECGGEPVEPYGMLGDPVPSDTDADGTAVLDALGLPVFDAVAASIAGGPVIDEPTEDAEDLADISVEVEDPAPEPETVVWRLPAAATKVEWFAGYRRAG